MELAQKDVSWFRKADIRSARAQSHSTNLMERHPFDVEIMRLTPGTVPYPYHSHSAQWEFYHIISGPGTVRHQDGNTPVVAGDAFLFKPGEPHQIVNDGDGGSAPVT